MFKRIIDIALLYLIWLPCALLKDLVEILYVPFDINRFTQTYVNMRITQHNIEASLQKISETESPEQKERYKHTNIGFTADLNKCDLTVEEEEDEEICSLDV